MSKKLDLNDFQKIILEKYEGGDFSYIQTREDIDDCGDSILRFLLLELATKEDCDSPEEAMRHIESAVTQLNKASGWIMHATLTAKTDSPVP